VIVNDRPVAHKNADAKPDGRRGNRSRRHDPSVARVRSLQARSKQSKKRCPKVPLLGEMVEIAQTNSWTADDGERLDSRAASKASQGNQAMATVDTFHGPRTARPTVRFSPATTVCFTTAANKTRTLGVKRQPRPVYDSLLALSEARSGFLKVTTR
jgi:hypothetical protein